MAADFVIGVDLGGTNVRAGAFDQKGKTSAPTVSIPSNAQNGTDEVLDAIVAAIHAATSGLSGAPLAIGMAIPGHIDDAAGKVCWSPNFGDTVDGVFRHWLDVQIKQPLLDRLKSHISLSMGNDANLAALGEYSFGSGKGSARCLTMLTIGTGIGGGVIMSPDSVMGDARGKLVLLGGNKGGAELGHVLISQNGLDCNAGSYGALEAYCQRDSIVRRALHKIQRGRESLLTDMAHGDLSLISPLMLDQAADQGDEVALEVWREVGGFLGAGIGSLINVFAPDVFAIGGQIAKAGERLLGPARDSARAVAIPTLYRDCKIVRAEQIDDAGMLGGAALAWETVRQQGTAS